MLKDLHIQNYRLFEDFKMEGLGQVNLIAGKNNTGKTALLEALRIWACKGDDTVVNNIIFKRGEFTPGWDDSYDSLFNRELLINFNDKNSEEFFIKINSLFIYKEIVSEYRGSNGEDVLSTLFGVREEKNDMKLNYFNSSTNFEYPNDRSVFVPFTDKDFPINRFWENIALTDKEDDIVAILKILDNNIARIDILENGAKVKLANLKKPLPLKNLGEGANRLLVLALALVSAKGKLLLIDEFESGLHYSVQEQLWGIVFEYAKKWDIQVFATTHSMDTVKSFFYVQEKKEYDGMGKFFRLQTSRKGHIEAITYDESKLEFALEHQLDPR